MSRVQKVWYGYRGTLVPASVTAIDWLIDWLVACYLLTRETWNPLHSRELNAIANDIRLWLLKSIRFTEKKKQTILLLNTSLFPSSAFLHDIPVSKQLKFKQKNVGDSILQKVSAITITTNQYLMLVSIPLGVAPSHKGSALPGFDRLRRQWSQSNRFRTVQSHCGGYRKKWRNKWALTDDGLCSLRKNPDNGARC